MSTMDVPPDQQCQHGTAHAGSVGSDRCENDADTVYLGYGEDHKVYLCQGCYESYMKSDYYSGAGDY